jgi:hypothetical protein
MPHTDRRSAVLRVTFTTHRATKIPLPDEPQMNGSTSSSGSQRFHSLCIAKGRQIEQFSLGQRLQSIDFMVNLKGMYRGNHPNEGLKGEQHEESRFGFGCGVGSGTGLDAVGAAGSRGRWRHDLGRWRSGMGLLPHHLRSAPQDPALRMARSVARLMARGAGAEEVSSQPRGWKFSAVHV